MAYDEFMTPPHVIELARKYLGTIDLDPASCSIAQQYVKATTYFDKSQNGLTQRWYGNVWCNPPYSRELIKLFTKKLIQEYTVGSVEKALYLVNSATDTKWYHSLLETATYTILWNKRIKFWKMENGKALEKWEGIESIKRRQRNPNTKPVITNRPRYLSTLFIFDASSSVETVYSVFERYGTILQIA